VLLVDHIHDVIKYVQVLTPTPDPPVYLLKAENPDDLLLVIKLRAKQYQFAVSHLLLLHQLLNLLPNFSQTLHFFH
jgi:hypothetical protein